MEGTLYRFLAEKVMEEAGYTNLPEIKLDEHHERFRRILKKDLEKNVDSILDTPTKDLVKEYAERLVYIEKGVERFKAIDKKVEESLRVSDETWNRIIRAEITLDEEQIKKDLEDVRIIDDKCERSLYVSPEALNRVYNWRFNW